MLGSRQLVRFAVAVATVACGSSSGQPSAEGGVVEASDEGAGSSRDAGAEADADGSSSDAVAEDAAGDGGGPRGVDSCTDCIIARCANELAACDADPGCASGWALFEQCRASDAGSINCWIEFGMIDDSQTSDVIGCAMSAMCCNP